MPERFYLSNNMPANTGFYYVKDGFAYNVDQDNYFGFSETIVANAIKNLQQARTLAHICDKVRDSWKASKDFESHLLLRYTDSNEESPLRNFFLQLNHRAFLKLIASVTAKELHKLEIYPEDLVKACNIIVTKTNLDLVTKASGFLEGEQNLQFQNDYLKGNYHILFC
jgi:hypothetical protein